MNTDADAVVDAVCMTFHVERAALLGPGRSQRVAWPRLVAYYVLRQHLGWMLTDIGAVFGRDHATVHHGIARVAGRCRVTRADREMVDDLIASVDERRAHSVSDQAYSSARASLAEAVERIDAMVSAALARRAQLVTAIAIIDAPDAIVRVA